MVGSLQNALTRTLKFYRQKRKVGGNRTVVVAQAYPWPKGPLLAPGGLLGQAETGGIKEWGPLPGGTQFNARWCLS